MDDEIVAPQPQRWKETRDLLDAVAQVAEERGARLCFRFREAFCSASQASGFLPDLEARGHEVGVHAHGRYLARTFRAVEACGIDPRVAVPGLVQAGHTGRPVMLRQAASLGISLVTDHGGEPAWAYDGLSFREEHGVLVMAPTVRPFDWGLMEKDGTRHGVTHESVARLRQLEATASDHGAEWFGFALHEHDLCTPGSLELRQDALEALAEYLDERVVPTLGVPGELQEGNRSRIPLGDHRVRASRLARRAMERIPRPRRPQRGSPPRGGVRVEIAVGDRGIIAQRFAPARPVATLVVSHAGDAGGRRLALQPFGLRIRELMSDGWRIWLYDRSGTGDSPPGPLPGLTPGNPDHLADWKAVLGRARADGGPVLALTWSGGIVPVLAAARDGDRPDALLDGEGPVDRWSLVPPASMPGSTGDELRTLDPWRDEDWDGLEAIRLIEHLKCPYVRLQGNPDHLHGSMMLHAERIVAAASRAGVAVGDPVTTEGPLHQHPSEVLAALTRVLEAIPGMG